MRECPQCLADIHEADRMICAVCGCELAPPRPAAAPPSFARAPDQLSSAPSEEAAHFRRQFEECSIFVPERVLRRAEEVLASAEAELRRATVLLVDLCGFTRAGSEKAPEELSRWAREFYKISTDCILRRGGFVVKFMGDAVLAVFGAPVAFDRDVESAVLAALDIREQCEQRQGRPRAMAVSIGLATGVVQAGPLDTPTGKRFDVLGNTVNLASRLQGAAGENRILICPATHEAVHRHFSVRPTEPLTLKNMPAPLTVFEVIARTAEEEGEALRFFETPFMGRQNEMESLAGFLSQSGGGGTRVALVDGEAGIGKTRLVHEALGAAGKAADAIWWKAAPFSSSILLWPVLEWLRKEILSVAQEPPDPPRKSIRRYLALRLPGEDADSLLLEYLFGIPEAVRAMQGIPPERIQRNLFGLLRMLLACRVDKQTEPVLIVDDSQWLDPLTLKFLRQLVEWPDASRLILVLVHRSGAETHLPSAPDHLKIHLQALPERDRQLLMEKIVPTEEFLPEIRKLVLSRAAGNPLFLEEMTRLVRHVMQNNRDLNGEKLRNHIVDVIPVSLQDLIQSRIDRLEARTRQVLQCASLLGLDFALSLIELFDMVREGLAGHLHSLSAMRYLDKLPALDDVHYYFTHGLYRDVAYSTLLEEQKQALHAGLAARLEQVFADRIQEYYELLAFHYARAANPQKAVYYLVKAADRQTGLGEAGAAIENYQEAIELLRGQAASAARQTLMARLLIRCARLQRTLGNGEQADEMLEGALVCAGSLGNERLILEARLEQTISILWRGEYEEAIGALDPLADEASRLDARAALMVALNALGVAHLQMGRQEKALETFQKLAKCGEGDAAPQVQADAFNNAGLIYWRWAQYTQALRAFKRAVPLRRQARDQFGLCATLMNMGIIQEQIGQVGAARKSYENACRLAHKTGHVQALAALESNLSNLERRLGNALAAVEHAARAIEYSQLAEDPNLESIAQENMGLARAARGEAEEAGTHLERALELARGLKNVERETEVRLSILQTWMEAGLGESSVGVPSAEGPTPKPGVLEEINDLLKAIERNRYAELLPRAYRIKARVLDALDAVNARTAREYLDLAQEKAREAGNFFEELESWQAALEFAGRHADAALAADCARKIEAMKKMMER